MSDSQLPAHDHLDQLNIPYERASFPTDIDKGAASVARALGYEERQMVKTLLFTSGEGEHCLVMVGGDQSVISGRLKKAVGNRNLRMTAPETVLEVTGYVVGSIPPFHWQPAGFRSFLDADLRQFPVLGVGTGQWGEEILIRPADLIRASDAIVVNLTDPERPHDAID